MLFSTAASPFYLPAHSAHSSSSSTASPTLVIFCCFIVKVTLMSISPLNDEHN